MQEPLPLEHSYDLNINFQHNLVSPLHPEDAKLLNVDSSEHANQQDNHAAFPPSRDGMKLKNDKMTFTGMEGVRVVAVLELDIEKLNDMVNGMNEIRRHMVQSLPHNLYLDNQHLKSQLSALRKEKQEAIMERDSLRKMAEGYGILEMCEDILKKEKMIKTVKAAENFKKFELGLKLIRANTQLDNGAFIGM
jgi:hypothetical protein